mgnify:CR=1 FL=1
MTEQNRVDNPMGTDGFEFIEYAAPDPAAMGALFERMGFTVERAAQEHFGDDLIARRQGKGGANIMLLGHADTVFPAGTTAQRPMSLGEDRIFGPGTCDMKAGIAAAVIGNGISVSLMALATCPPSGKWGLEQYTALRSVLGRHGVKVVVFGWLLAIEIGWAAVLSIMFGRSTTNVINEVGRHAFGPNSIVVTLFAIVAIVIAWLVLAKGPVSIKWFNTVVAPGLFVIQLVMLVLLFKDFLHPFTILAALPLSLGGAFVGLLIADKSFSMPSLIGLIMLMGIATKNSILLVEYAIVARRDHGMSRFDALLDACHKRARPIIMTTLAMGAGMLPLAMSLGAADSSFRSPMAVAVIGGLMTSTVLSLLVIPSVFTVMDDFEHLMRRMVNWIRRKPAL